MLNNFCFWFAALVALGASVLAVSRRNAVHGLLWLVLSLLAVAVLFFMLGAPFAAALEVIVYAGAIMVLFLFAVMMLHPGPAAQQQEAQWLAPGVWIAPGLLALGLATDLIAIARLAGDTPAGAAVIPPEAVGAALFGPYVIGVELASVLLLAGVVAAYHLGQRRDRSLGEEAGSG